MTFNLAKCNSMTVTRKKNTIYHIYKLHNEKLDRVNSATYLGLELTENLSWNRHIENSCNKATKTLSFLRRNLKVNNVNAKEAAYKGLVRPTLEYCCAVWDPHYKKHMHMLEMVQRRAARFVLHRYHNTSSVTDMLQLKWDLLCQCRARIRLAMLYKIQHGLVALSLPSMIHRPIRPRPGSLHACQTPYCSTDSFKFSFFPRTVIQWNSLPQALASAPTLSQFKGGLAGLTI